MTTRLLLVSQPLDFGVPRHVRDIVESLPANTFAVTLACPRGSLLWKAFSGQPGVTLHPIGSRRRPSPGDAVSLVRLMRLARKADVIHAHSSKAGFLTRMAARLTGRVGSCAFTPHAWSFWGFSGPSRRVYLALERMAARWCATIVAVSAAERDAGLAVGVGRPEQYRVILHGIDLDRFGLARRPDPGRIVMVARLAPQKRPDLAVKAMAALRAKGREATLEIMGDGPLMSSTADLVAELGLTGIVWLVGAVDDLPERLAAAACLLLTSEYEGSPLSVLEAMAAGVPVVAVNIPSVAEVIDHGVTGLLVEPDPEAIATAIDRLLGHPDEATAMGEAARTAAIARFSKSRMMEELAELYSDLSSRPR